MIKEKITLIVMASGQSVRFPENKLLWNFEGRPLYSYLFDTLSIVNRLERGVEVLVCAEHPAILETAEKLGFIGLHNENAQEGQSASIRLAMQWVEAHENEQNEVSASVEGKFPLECLLKKSQDKQGWLVFFTADQPYLSVEDVRDFLHALADSKAQILESRSPGGQKGTPVAFRRELLPRLRALQGDQGGKAIYSEDLCIDSHEAADLSLMDIDTLEDVEKVRAAYAAAHKKRCAKISEALVAWYDIAGRDHLPWRNEPTPYHVWISEIMLQQTRVEAVLPYFQRFMEAFPTVEALAEAPLDQVLKYWEGLGYYSRCRNLHKAAQEIAKKAQGFPKDVEGWLALPGIGAYTAGAISSIACHQQVIAADGNAYRVSARLCAEEGILESALVKRRLEAFLKELLPKRAGDFNQALMDLGSSICTPKNPHCDRCPLHMDCLGYKRGIAEGLPRRKPKKPRRIEKKSVYVFTRGDKLLLEKRGEEGLLAKLWGFPMVEGWHEPSQELLRHYVPSGVEISIQPFGSSKHVFSHVEWHMKAWRIELEETVSLVEDASVLYAKERQKQQEEKERTWMTMEQQQKAYSVPSAFQPFLPLEYKK